MDIDAIETDIQTALTTAGIANPILQRHYSMTFDEVRDVYLDKTKDAPRLNFCVINVFRTGSERYASYQVLEYGRVDITYYIAINEDQNTHLKAREDLDTIVDTLDDKFTYGDEVDRTLPPISSGLSETNIKGFQVWTAVVSQNFEVPKTVANYD